MAERLTRARLREPSGIQATSSGVRAQEGAPVDSMAARVLTLLGVDPYGHRARRLTRRHVESADLVLAATVEQRDALVRAVPLAWRRTFAMREFARLGASLPAPRPGPAGNKLARRVADVAAMRGVLEPPPAGEDDIADASGSRPAAMERCGQQIARTVDEILQVLGVVVLV